MSFDANFFHADYLTFSFVSMLSSTRCISVDSLKNILIFFLLSISRTFALCGFFFFFFRAYHLF